MTKNKHARLKISLKGGEVLSYFLPVEDLWDATEVRLQFVTSSGTRIYVKTDQIVYWEYWVIQVHTFDFLSTFFKKSEMVIFHYSPWTEIMFVSHMYQRCTSDVFVI